MTSDATEARRGRSLRARSRRVILPGAVVLLVVGAFLPWGPMGLGNGPLGVPAMSDSVGTVQSTTQPTAYVATLVNAGRSTAVIDRVTVAPAPGYSPARVLSARVAGYSEFGCFDYGPANNLAACARPPFVAAAGLAVAPRANTVAGNRHGPALVIEMARPSDTQCVVVTAIVVRYHVDIRHYTATVPQGEVWACGEHAHTPHS